MVGGKRDGDDGGADAGELRRLVAMRKDDYSWHPCKISLCSDRVGLNVEYVKDGSKDVIFTKEEAFARLRFCSPPLQLEECNLIGQGERVLANPKSQAKDVFFEADIEKQLNVRHTRTQCRCNFVVRWARHGFDGETVVLPLSAIVKILATCIDIHPTILAFFNILANSQCSFSLVSTLVKKTKDGVGASKLESEDSDCEMDALELERQIECISNSAAASEMESSEKLMLGVQADDRCGAQYNSTTTHSSIFTSHFCSLMKEKGGESTPTPPPKVPTIKEDPVKRASHNPQGAIAQLAFEKSKLSVSPECSSTLKDANIFKPHSVCVNSKGGTPHHVSLTSSFNVEEHHIRNEVVMAKSVLKNKSIVKKLFSSDEARNDHRILDESTDASEQEESKNLKSQPGIVDSIFSARTEAMKKPSSLTRKRNTRISGENSEINCIAKANLLPPSVTTRRLTRSDIRKMEDNHMNKENPSSVQDRDLLEEAETVVSTCVAETASTLTTKRKRLDDNGVTNHEQDPDMRTHFFEIKTPNNLRRLTRSSARMETESNDVKHHKRFESSEPSDLIKGNIPSESRLSERGNPVTLPLNPSLTAERCNEVETSAPVKLVLHIEGDDNLPDHACDNRVTRKSANHKKQQQGESLPRLTSRPRTRSQMQS